MISIIIPIYKAEDYLSRCIDSVISQTYTDWECILVDDGSPDKSGEICDDYSRKDERIRVLHKANGGVSSARNLGIDIAKGEWVTFVDADDYILPDYIERLMKHTDADLIISGSRHFGFNNTDYSIPEDRRYDIHKFVKCIFDCDPSDNIYTNCVSYPWGKILKRSLIEQNTLRFNTKMKLAEDTCFMVEYLGYIEDVLYVSGGSYMYFTTSAPKTHLKMSFKEYKNHVEGISYSINALATKHKQDSFSYFTKLYSMLFDTLMRGLSRLPYKEQSNQLSLFKQSNHIPMVQFMSGMSRKRKTLLKMALCNGVFFHFIIPVLYR